MTFQLLDYNKPNFNDLFIKQQHDNNDKEYSETDIDITLTDKKKY